MTNATGRAQPPDRLADGSVWYTPMAMPPHPVEFRHGSTGRRYLRAPVVREFPVEALVPESTRHLELRTALYFTIRRWFGERVHVGSDQFVYFDPTDPRSCCAPDLFVRLGDPHADFETWKTWERGAPHLAVEIVSRSDREDAPWEVKLERYLRVGVPELVRFDADDAERPLRIWDQVEGDLVERDPEDATFRRCDALNAYWLVVPRAQGGLELRLARDPEGKQPFLTVEEEKTEALAAAERRVKELEAENAKLRGR
jgi:hypothetical protein